MKKIFSIICLSLLLVPHSAHAVMWSVPLGSSGHHEVDFELDPYYSSIGYTQALTEEPIPKITVDDEGDVYLYMLENFYKPRYILFEGSVNPLPIAGVMIKKDEERFYNSSQVNPQINMVKSLTDGFPEPGAVSMLFGNVADFVVDDEHHVVGKGYSGFLLSLGNYHIVNNTMVQDYWQEAELKVKGSDVRERHKLMWSYALGVKLHQNHDIMQTFYFSIKRTRNDFVSASSFSIIDFFVRNSSQQIRADFSLQNPRERGMTRLLFLVGKNITFFDSSVTLGANIGFLKVFASGYSGALAEKIDTHWSFLIQPSLNFNF